MATIEERVDALEMRMRRVVKRTVELVDEVKRLKERVSVLENKEGGMVGELDPLLSIRDRLNQEDTP
jgi:hypothetical protein